MCCSPVESDSNLVIVTPAEIRLVMGAFDLSWPEVAEPYPEMIHGEQGHCFTIGWCIRRENKQCRFQKNGPCSIYESRPWICKTYPFSLSKEIVQTSPCPGLGLKISRDDAIALAKDLIDRYTAEMRDEDQIRSVLLSNPVLPECFVVIDSDGINYPERNSSSSKF